MFERFGLKEWNEADLIGVDVWKLRSAGFSHKQLQTCLDAHPLTNGVTVLHSKMNARNSKLVGPMRIFSRIAFM